MIGAGPIGLAMAKALKQRGIAYDHVDAGAGVGGNWRHGLYHNVHIVSSKRSTAFADFPMPSHYPHFPSAEQMLATSRAMRATTVSKRASRRGARSPRRAHARMTPGASCSMTGRSATTRAWSCATATIAIPHWPSYPGQFDGEIIHAHDYRGPDQLRGKRVLVIGGGNSACDIASEAARVGASCDLSLRSGYWFLPKMAFGRPLTDLPIWNLPAFLQRLILRGVVAMLVGDYRRYGLPRPATNCSSAIRHSARKFWDIWRKGASRRGPDIERLEGSARQVRDGVGARIRPDRGRDRLSQQLPVLGRTVWSR